MTRPVCDDCVCGGEGCAFLTSAEQPYFQAYRLAHRLPIGEAWKGLDYILWIGRQWSLWRKLNGHQPFQPVSTKQHAEFASWLFARVSHPMAVAA